MNQKHESNIEQRENIEKTINSNEENKDIKEIEEDNKDIKEIKEDNKDINEVKEETAEEDIPYFGSRILYEVPMQYNFRFLWEQIKHNVPEPVWPDPDKEPLPPPIIQQIIKKSGNRPEIPKVILFSIWTPVDKLLNKPEDEDPQEPEAVDPKAKKGKDAKDKTNNPKGKEEPKEVEIKEEEKGPLLDKSITRWILQPNESKTLHIKFFSSKIGKFNQTLNFEVLGSSKQFPLDIKAIWEFQTINSNPKNFFFEQKRQRLANPPDCYLQKCYISNENVFDFGPLLIGKDPEKRHEGDLTKSPNYTEFRISNNGKYDLNVKFCLDSFLVSNNPKIIKSPFIFEPESMNLKIDETQSLKVWWIPDEAKVYKDKIVWLIKDNPNSVVFNVMWTGSKPNVKVDNPIVQFDKLLLNKPSKRTLKIKNDCQIPVKWLLRSNDPLSPEYTISKTEGDLKPWQDTDIEINFCSEKQDQFIHKMILEVEDAEGFKIKQEPQEIQLLAEAFNISVNIDFKNDENIIDFEAVRVGDPKEKKLTLKNIGKYPVKYGFNIKKKTIREIFTIEPGEGVLAPEETKDIVVRFESKKEFKMKPHNQQAIFDLQYSKEEIKKNSMKFRSISM